ncbi:MAG: ankyrin repeat domain-containing protein [Myxococcota bacterium]
MLEPHSIDDETVAGEWLLLLVRDDALEYRHIVMREAEVGERRGSVTELPAIDGMSWDLPPMPGPRETFDSTDAARRECQRRLNEATAEGGVLVCRSAARAEWNEHRFDHGLIGFDIHGGDVGIVERIREQQLEDQEQRAQMDLRERVVWAICERNHAELGRLLAGGFTLSGTEYHVCHAVRMGDLRMVQALLAAGAVADGGTDDEIWVPLAVAAATGRADIAASLLEHGARIDRQDDHGWNPLHEAAKADADEVAALLLAGGLDPTARTKAGETPLEIAAAWGSRRVFERLVPGVPADVVDRARALLDRVTPPAERHPQTAALLWAAYRGRADEVQRLLEQGVPVDATAPHGRTATSEAERGGHDDVLALLARAKAAKP